MCKCIDIFYICGNICSQCIFIVNILNMLKSSLYICVHIISTTVCRDRTSIYGQRVHPLCHQLWLKSMVIHQNCKGKHIQTEIEDIRARGDGKAGDCHGYGASLKQKRGRNFLGGISLRRGSHSRALMTIGTLLSMRSNGSRNKDKVELEYSEQTHTDGEVDGEFGLRIHKLGRIHIQLDHMITLWQTFVLYIYSPCISGIHGPPGSPGSGYERDIIISILLSTM